MFVFSVARPFVCGCHIISTLPSARTIPGLPGSLASLLHRVARTHLGAMGWNQCAFAPIVRARPFPIFGRPVHPRDGSRRLRPGGSPHALQTPPRGGRPALQSFRSWLQLCLGRIRLSPSCPFRHLHYLSTLRPVRHYPHLLDIDPWPRAERDFNPPETRAARHALSAPRTPSRLRATSAVRPYTPGLCLTSATGEGLSCSALFCRKRATASHPGEVQQPLWIPAAVCCLRREMTGSALPNTFRLIL